MDLPLNLTNAQFVKKKSSQHVVLQVVAGCCNVLQCVAVCCSVLPCVAVCCGVLQCVAVCCSVLHCIAVCCSVLQCVAVCFSEFAVSCRVLPCVAVCYRVLPCVAVCCSVLQCVAVCSVLQGGSVMDVLLNLTNDQCVSHVMHTNESYHTCERVTSRMNESCHIRMSHVLLLKGAIHFIERRDTINRK